MIDKYLVLSKSNQRKTQDLKIN